MGVLFHAAGAATSGGHGSACVQWFEGRTPTDALRFDNHWLWSKMARNLSLAPMPDIGHPGHLWDEYCGVTLDAAPLIPAPGRARVRRVIDELGAPVIVLHAQGVTDRERKDIPAAILRKICRALLRQTEATILLLNWDDSLAPVPHWRIRYAQQAFGGLDPEHLLVLLDRADLVIGIDSGPLHAARYTRTPAIGVWMAGGSPATWALPRAMQVNVVVGPGSKPWIRQARLPFNILDCSGPEALPDLLGRTAARMLAGSRYLPAAQLGRDVLLQQFVRDWQGGTDNPFGGFNDRDAGFDRLLREAAQRFSRPAMVETGCVREEEDFAGAGFSTLLLGMFAAGHGGELISLDRSPRHCEFARETVACLGPGISVIEADSVSWLGAHRSPIDVLYLDSAESEQHGCAVQTLQEVQAASGCLQAGSIVAFDDTCFAGGGFIGTGAFAVPWLMQQGWRVLHSGHQTMLSRA